LKNLDQAGVIEIDRNRRKRLACGHLGMARTSRTSSRPAAIADDAVAQRCVAAPFRSPGFDAAAIRLSVFELHSVTDQRSHSSSAGTWRFVSPPAKFCALHC
jgi:hypothetical protein